MTVTQKGKRKAMFSGDFGFQAYYYVSPGITFESDKVIDNPKELSKLSGEVTTYKFEGEYRK